MKESYIYDFKMTYFKKLLIAGFNNSEAITSVVNSDHSGYGEFILNLEDYKLIDSLVRNDARKMSSDSLSGIGKVAEGSQGKHVFDYVLLKYESKWLDSLAKARYKHQFKLKEKHAR